MSRRGPSNSSPYGLACTNCFKSKCKCVARPGSDGCQRCHRLNKQCRPSDSVRRQTIDKKQDSSARISELESKLDGLISQLRSRNVIDNDPPEQQSAPEPNPLSESIGPFDNARIENQDPGFAEDLDGTGSARMSLTPRAVSRSNPPEHYTSEGEAETLLGLFRSRMLPNFAFMHLPAELTAHQLQEDRPFLYRAIACVASPSTTEKVALGRRLKRSFWEAMDESEFSPATMDLLLGILTYIAWGWDHLLNRCNLTRLMMQAVSLACEMRVEKPISKDSRLTALFTPGFDTWSNNTGTVTTQGFLERHRAILGCFALSSAVSAYFGQVDPLRWTPQMEDGLAAISTNKECPTDAAFGLQVRLQLIMQKTIQIHQQHQLEQGRAPAEGAGFPVLMSLATLQGQLQELQASLPPTMSEQNLIMAQIYSAELVLNETTHAVNSVVPLLVNQFARMIDPGSVINNSSRSAGQERSQSLWQCVRSIKASTSALLAFSPSDFAGISFLQWAQLARCVVVLNHLTFTIEDPVWDRAAVHAVVDISLLMNRVAEKLEQAAEAVGEVDTEGVFAQLARMMFEFRSKVTESAANERRVAEDMDAAWLRSRQYGGAGASTAVSMMGL